MAIIMRSAPDDFAAFQLAGAFDKHGVRVAAVVAPSRAPGEWRVFGQADAVDCDAVDATYNRIADGEEQP